MKNLIIALACTVYLMSCNNEKTGNETEDVPSAVDTTAHPTGVNEGAVISTDTAAYNVENTNPDGRENLQKDKKDTSK